MALLRRTGAAALLTLALAPAPSAAQTDGRVGQVILAAPQVTGRREGRPPDELRKQSPVFEKMEVKTSAHAGTRIAINTDLPQKGMVALGPRTTVELTRRLVNQALGLEKMSWLVKLGQFWLALVPPPEGAALQEGEYLIETPDKTQIRLQGTSVAVEVARDGTTTVWVLEGEVTVTTPAGGAPVRVPAGYRMRVRHGRPSPPVRFGRPGGAAPPLLPNPWTTIFPDPPHLSLRQLRDLPK